MSDALFFQNNDHRHSHAQNRFAVIPTAGKLNANPRFTGKGVCLAFLDSGFYPHPDFASRVVAFHDVAGEEKSFHSIQAPKSHHWHGTQTVLLEFESEEAAREWYYSDAYQEAVKLRQAAADCNGVILHGLG